MNSGFIAIFVLSILLAITATVLAFIFIVPDKKRQKLGAFGKFLHDTVNFKYLIIEKILQALYIFATSMCILLGFLMLFYVQPGYEYMYYTSPSVWYGGYGILLMILGPISIRLSYELIMMAILLVKNVIQINNKLKGDGDTKEQIFTTPTFEPTPAAEVPQQPAAKICPACGVTVENGAFCPVCGVKID